MVDNLRADVKELKKGGAFFAVIEAEARAFELTHQLEDVKHHLNVLGE